MRGDVRYKTKLSAKLCTHKLVHKEDSLCVRSEITEGCHTDNWSMSLINTLPVFRALNINVRDFVKCQNNRGIQEAVLADGHQSQPLEHFGNRRNFSKWNHLFWFRLPFHTFSPGLVFVSFDESQSCWHHSTQYWKGEYSYKGLRTSMQIKEVRQGLFFAVNGSIIMAF